MRPLGNLKYFSSHIFKSTQKHKINFHNTVYSNISNVISTCNQYKNILHSFYTKFKMSCVFYAYNPSIWTITFHWKLGLYLGTKFTVEEVDSHISVVPNKLNPSVPNTCIRFVIIDVCKLKLQFINLFLLQRYMIG